MKEFDKWQRLHQNKQLIEFIDNHNGILWLKVKSIMRSDLLKAFCKKYKIPLESTLAKDKFRELYEVVLSDVYFEQQLDAFILEENEKSLKKLKADKLVSQLYKVQHFEWGGDNANALDKYLVKHYVKDLNSYDKLVSKCKNEIPIIVQNYLVNSWYNHWSSILIEHIFKSQRGVLPAIGQIQNVDFFIQDVPLDLKVTYLPAEYQKERRKFLGLPTEVTFLKKAARSLEISFDKTANEKQIEYEILEKLRNSDREECKAILEEFKLQRAKLILEAALKPELLIVWLYEHQGEMRFSAENRLFMVLIDPHNLEDSWKLKRDFERLSPEITQYVENFDAKNLKTIDFEYKGNKYSAKADILFVVKK